MLTSLSKGYENADPVQELWVFPHDGRLHDGSLQDGPLPTVDAADGGAVEMTAE